jgi:hypothetical protein
MGVQTSVVNQTTATFAGAIADMGDVESDTYVNGETSAEIPFGRMVRENSDHVAKLLAGASPVLAGIAMQSHALAGGGGASGVDVGLTGYKVGSTLGVARRGVIWVYTEEAVSPTDEVRVRHTANGAGKEVGQFLEDADSGKSLLITNGAHWRSSTSGAGLAMLEIDMAALTFTADS